VIAATGGPVTGLAVKAATATIPFVFISGQDPVKLGFVASFAKPGGNATGVNMFITAVEAKRLGLLHELAPSASQIAVIVNPNSPELDTQLSDIDRRQRDRKEPKRFASWQRKRDRRRLCSAGPGRSASPLGCRGSAL
jgi:ABC-type uncharacterized transport system substrate-binding protein